MANTPQTLFDKIWLRHEVSAESAATPAVLYIDLHLVHEVTSPQAFAVLRERGLSVRRPELTLATMPLAVTTAPHPCSSSASAVASRSRVGFPERV